MVFDPTLVDEMIALMGAEATGEIASSLELEGSENISALKAAVSAGDAPADEREAHTLASSCLSLGLKSAGTLLRQVEADIRQGNLPTEAAVRSAEGFFFDGLTSLRSHLLNAISNPDA